MNLDLNKYMKYHIDIEFFYKQNDFLLESARHINNISKWTNTVYEKIYNELSMHNKIKNDVILLKDDFDVDVFFDECIIELNANVETNTNSNTCSVTGEYLLSSGYDENKKYTVKILLNILGSLPSSSKTYSLFNSEVKSTLAHELAHAYVDYNQNRTISAEDKKIEDNIDTQYLVYTGFTSNNMYIRDLVSCIYFSMKSEVHAMQNEISIQIMNLRNGVRDSKTANEIIQKTGVYQRLILYEEKLNKLKFVDDIIKEELLQEYNKIFNTNINDYAKMISKLNVRMIYARNKIIDAAANYIQVAYTFRNAINYNEMK